MKDKSQAIKEYIRLRCMAWAAMMIHDDLFALNMGHQVNSKQHKAPKRESITRQLDNILDFIWTVGDLANVRHLRKFKDIVVDAQTNVRLCSDALYSQGDAFLIGSDAEYPVDFERQDHIARLAWDRCGVGFLRLHIACTAEILLMSVTSEAAAQYLGMSMDDFNNLGSSKIEQILDSWELPSNRTASAVNARNMEWLKQSESGRTAKEIAADWRKQTGEEVTSATVRQGISRSRDKK